MHTGSHPARFIRPPCNPASATPPESQPGPLLLTLTAAFAVLTAAIVAHTGLLGFYRQLLDAPAAWQTRVDITIALGLALTWMWRDARRTGRACWPWVPVTLLLGSVGPLL